MKNDIKEAFKEWIKEQHEKVVARYKLALIKEISASLRIMGRENLHEFKTILHNSLKQIKPPTYTAPPFNIERDLMIKWYNEIPAPNFNEILEQIKIEYDVI